MQLTTISINNLKRRKAKMAFLLIGMIIGIATIVALYSITSSMEKEIGNKFDQIGANMLVTPKSDALTLSYQGVAVSGVSFDVKELDESAIPKIRSIKNSENVAIIAPKLLGEVEVNGKKALAIGVEFDRELTMKKWWKLNTDPTNSEQVLGKPWKNLKLQKKDVVLGSVIANKLGAKPGSTVKISSKDYGVAAVLHPMGVEEDKAILMDLSTTQAILNKPGKFSMIELAALCNTCPIEEITAQIAEKLPQADIRAVKEAVEARKAIVEKFSDFAMAISVVVLFIGSLIVFLSMMGSVNERTREIGIFRAIGFRQAHVAQIILTEAFLVSIVGGITGYLAGVFIAKGTAPFIAQMDLLIPWSLGVGIVALAISILVGITASVFPAWKAAKLNPAEALRFI